MSYGYFDPCKGGGLLQAPPIDHPWLVWFGQKNNEKLPDQKNNLELNLS